MHFKTIFGLVILSFLLSACNPLSPVDELPQATYALSAQPIKALKANEHAALTLLVMQPEAGAGYQTSDMIYTKQAYRLESFAKNRWVAPPAQMLLPLLVQQLQATNYFHAVVAAPFAGAAQFRLTTQLLELQQDFSQPISTVNMTIAAQLINNKTYHIVASQVFKIKVPVASNDPYSGVVAANQATQKLLQQIAKFVVVNS